MALEEIGKLKEKVTRDPNSKLFVPLADEYRKMGMLDEAISVLLTGLENQPGYMSARVALGKIYLEKQMMNESKEEFEKVIAAIPDNLFAHKKLAEIYRDIGDRSRAIAEYKTVLKLNAIDEDALTSLEALQSTPKVAESAAETPQPAEEVQAEEIQPEEVQAEEAQEEEPVPAETVEEVVVAEEAVETLPAEEAPHPVSEEEFEEFRKSVAERIESAEKAEEAIPEADASEAEKEAEAYAGIFKGADVKLPPSPLEVTVSESKSAPESLPETKTPAVDIKDAESSVAKGDYSKALSIYKKMLSAEPDNKQLLQKIEELKMLLKMLGKEQEVLIGNLETFVAGLRKRKDEFLRNP